MRNLFNQTKEKTQPVIIGQSSHPQENSAQNNNLIFEFDCPSVKGKKKKCFNNWLHLQDDLIEKIELLSLTIEELKENNDLIKKNCKEIDEKCLQRIDHIEVVVSNELERFEDYPTKIKQFEDKLKLIEAIVAKKRIQI